RCPIKIAGKVNCKVTLRISPVAKSPHATDLSSNSALTEVEPGRSGRERSARTPTKGRSSELRRYGLDLGIIRKHFATHLPAPSGLLVAAKGQGCVEDVMAVDPHRAGADETREPVRLADVLGPDAGSEAIDRVIRFFGNSFQIGVVKGFGADHRPKNLLADDLHRGLGVGQHGRLDEIATIAASLFPAGHNLRAVLDARLDVAGDTLELHFGDERTHVGLWVEPRANLDLLCFGRHAFDDLVEDVLVRIEPRSGAAALAVIEEDRAGGAGNCRADVRVAKNDRGRLAAEFERYLLQIAGRGFDDELADFGRSGERNLVDIVVGRERGA